MTLNRNKPVQLRDGREAVVLDWDVPDTGYPIWARAYIDGSWRHLKFAANGQSWQHLKGDRDDDLINAPEKHERPPPLMRISCSTAWTESRSNDRLNRPVPHHHDRV